MKRGQSDPFQFDGNTG